MHKIGIDTGGTFTDFVLYGDEGIQIYKISSTPDDPARAILKGLLHFFHNRLPDDLEIFHGSTVGINAFLERKGARTVLVTTYGFEDVLFIGRQNRNRLYDFNVEKPIEIIPRSMVVGVKERIRYDGSVQIPLGNTVGKRLRAFCRQVKAQSVAVCFLHSYANSSHERAIKKELASLNIPIILSSEILPEFREYERLTTTLINAYLAPVISSYIMRLKKELQKRPLFIQQSNGGVLPAENIGDRAVNMLLSGPAGGVHGAMQLAEEIDQKKIITFDMGGTSTDVSLCDGSPTLTRDYRIDEYPVRIQVFDIHSVGAGGGSLARIDAGGLLQVGPQSAGSDPGPVCYGMGRELTVTDANLFIGRLLPDKFLGGEMPLETKHVEKLMNNMALQLKMEPVPVALGIIKITNASMSKAIRAVSLERGHDPKDFSLFSFGGASGLHCCELAEDLGIPRIVVPARAGILSAQGMVFADLSFDRLQALFLRGPQLTIKALDRAFLILEKNCREEINSITYGRNIGEEVIKRYLNLRYSGQSFELCVAYDKDFTESFHAAHETAFGYRLDDTPLELISIQCTCNIIREKGLLPSISISTKEKPVVEMERDMFFEEGLRRIPVYERKKLKFGHEITGPALIVDNYTTVLLTDGFFLSVDSYLNFILERKG